MSEAEDSPEAHHYTHPPEAPTERADKVLARAFPQFSRTQLQRALDDGRVRREGRIIARRGLLEAGEQVTFTVKLPENHAAHAVDIPLSVLYEDEAVIAVNKAAGMVVHPGSNTGSDTLVHALLHHCGPDHLSRIGAPERPGIVHRLDKETSGVIIVAKTDAAHRALEQQFAERSNHKEYRCLVRGAPHLKSGTIRAPIVRHSTIRTRMQTLESTAEQHQRQGRNAHTDWFLVQTYGKHAAHLRCVIHTGRTHQIRVHLKHIGHPLLGDKTYGWSPDQQDTVQPARVLLHAHQLKVAHPISGKPLCLEAPLPPDFTEYEAWLESK